MSRSSILAAVRAASPPPVPLPDLGPLHAASPAADVEAMVAVLEMIGARCVRGAGLAAAKTWLAENVPAGAGTASMVPGLPGTVDLAGTPSAHGLDGLHTAILPARFGVCENGAVWMDEAELGPHRALPFIAEHLFIVLNARDLVPTLHQAYARIGAIGTGFGLFLAGPSKTADIEQCLVIGAHGARGATVFLLEHGEEL